MDEMSSKGKFLGKLEGWFRKSHGSRIATGTALQGAARTAESTGNKESRGNSAPASRNAAEVVEKFDEILTGIGSSG